MNERKGDAGNDQAQIEAKSFESLLGQNRGYVEENNTQRDEGYGGGCLNQAKGEKKRQSMRLLAYSAQCWGNNSQGLCFSKAIRAPFMNTK